MSLQNITGVSKHSMNNRYYASIGFFAPVLFWSTYFIMANQRPEYSFMHKAISELGSVDAPDKWTWNILGYIVPGICISIFSVGLYKAISSNDSNKVPVVGMFLSGLFMAVSGVFPGDFEDRTSMTMVLHTLGSFGSYIGFLIGAFTFPKLMKRTSYWATVVPLTKTAAWMTILFGSWVFIFPDMPAVGQRIVFIFYFLWIVITARKLYFATGTNRSV